MPNKFLYTLTFLILFSSINVAGKNDDYIKTFYAKRKSKNIAVLLIIISLVILFFFITILRMDITG